MISLLIVAVKGYTKCTTRPDSAAGDDSGADRSGSDACCSGLLASELFATTLNDAGASRYQLTDDDILFQTNQVIGLGLDGSFGQDAGRLLEGGGGEEAIGIERCLRDTQQDGLSGGRLATFC